MEKFVLQPAEKAFSDGAYSEYNKNHHSIAMNNTLAVADTHNTQLEVFKRTVKAGKSKFLNLLVLQFFEADLHPDGKTESSVNWRWFS